jgi:hypothetical protein
MRRRPRSISRVRARGRSTVDVYPSSLIGRMGSVNLAHLHGRIEKIRDWWNLMDEGYADLLSRNELATVSGPDPDPQTKLCEHRKVWMVGKLCLASDNTGWRPLTEGERAEGAGMDPYLSQLSSGITIVKDEGREARQIREGKRMDAALTVLERNAEIRAGRETPEDRELRNLRIVSRRPRTLRKIAYAIHLLRVEHPVLYERLPSTPSLAALAILIPGKIDRP